MASNKREDIMSAALYLFAERGYDGTTVPMIAEKAHVGAGTIYRYFENKEVLVNALFQESVRHFSGTLKAKESDFNSDVRKQFDTMFFQMVSYAKEHPYALQFIDSHANGHYLDDESRQVFQEFLDCLCSVTEYGKQQGVLRSLPSEALICIVYGAFSQFFKLVRVGELEEDQQLLEEVADCCWNAIRIH
ncbi:MAG: TetR/AcrR family transcriptional regulator [Bacillus sp. (in: firmicutes)]